MPPLYQGNNQPFNPPRAALDLLLEGYESARLVGSDPWEFAVEITLLADAGLTCNQLRWMLHQQYLTQAIERSRPQDTQRRFKPCKNLRLWEGSCFVLTEAGAAFIHRKRNCRVDQPEQQSIRKRRETPVWDEHSRVLRLGQVVVKHFRQPAPNQERILAVFQEEGWPIRIEDPLPMVAGLDPKRRLHSTISNLNRGQRQRRIHFEGGGDGESVCWRLLGSKHRSEYRAKTKQG